jgi:16S rRNA processing protein RimM
MPEPKEDWICLGVIGAPHGVRGELRVRSFTETPEDLAAYGPLTDDVGRVWRLHIKRRHKNGIIATLDGIRDRDAAEGLKGQKLHVARAVLPELDEEETYYHVDLIGLEVRLEDGTIVGSILAVHDFGAGDLLEIVRQDGEKVLIPFTAEAVPQVDLAGGCVIATSTPELVPEAEAAT